MAEVLLVVRVQGAREAQAAVDRLTQGLTNQGRQTSRAAQQTQRFNQSLSGTSVVGRTLLRSVILPLTAALSGTAIIKAADQFKLLESRLKFVTTSAEELIRTQQRLFQISQETGTSFATNLEVFTRFVRNAETLGRSGEEILQFTENIQKLVVSAGESGESARAALIQLSQGLATGTVRGEELRSVMEQIPSVAKAIADGLGLGIGQFRDLSLEGKIFAQDIIDSLLSATGKIDEAFKKFDQAPSQAFTRVKNSLFLLVGALDEATGATTVLSGGLNSTSNFVDALTAAIKRLSGGGELGSFVDALDIAAGRLIVFFGSLAVDVIEPFIKTFALALSGIPLLFSQVFSSIAEFLSNTEGLFSPLLPLLGREFFGGIGDAAEGLATRLRVSSDGVKIFSDDLIAALRKTAGVIETEFGTERSLIETLVPPSDEERLSRVTSEFEQISETLKGMKAEEAARNSLLERRKQIQADLAAIEKKKADAAENARIKETKAEAKRLETLIEVNNESLERLREFWQRRVELATEGTKEETLALQELQKVNEKILKLEADRLEFIAETNDAALEDLREFWRNRLRLANEGTRDELDALQELASINEDIAKRETELIENNTTLTVQQQRERLIAVRESIQEQANAVEDGSERFGLALRSVDDALRDNQKELDNTKTKVQELAERFRDSFITVPDAVFGALTSVRGAFRDLFTDIFTQSKSIGDALGDFFDTIVDSILTNLARLVADSIFQLLFGIGGTGGGLFGGGGGAGGGGGNFLGSLIGGLFGGGGGSGGGLVGALLGGGSGGGGILDFIFGGSSGAGASAGAATEGQIGVVGGGGGALGGLGGLGLIGKLIGGGGDLLDSIGGFFSGGGAGASFGAALEGQIGVVEGATGLNAGGLFGEGGLFGGGGFGSLFEGTGLAGGLGAAGLGLAVGLLSGQPIEQVLLSAALSGLGTAFLGPAGGLIGNLAGKALGGILGGGEPPIPAAFTTFIAGVPGFSKETSGLSAASTSIPLGNAIVAEFAKFGFTGAQIPDFIVNVSPTVEDGSPHPNPFSVRIPGQRGSLFKTTAAALVSAAPDFLLNSPLVDLEGTPEGFQRIDLGEGTSKLIPIPGFIPRTPIGLAPIAAQAPVGGDPTFGGNNANLPPGLSGISGTFQTGGSRVVTRPSLFLAGEGGPERATFTPLGSGGVSDDGLQVNINGPTFFGGDLAFSQVERQIGRAFSKRQQRTRTL